LEDQVLRAAQGVGRVPGRNPEEARRVCRGVTRNACAAIGFLVVHASGGIHVQEYEQDGVFKVARGVAGFVGFHGDGVYHGSSTGLFQVDARVVEYS